MRQFVWAKEDRFVGLRVVLLSTDRERRDCPERDDKEEPHGFAGAFARAPKLWRPNWRDRSLWLCFFGSPERLSKKAS